MLRVGGRGFLLHRCVPWLRTHGVNTNRAAAKVINFDRLGKKVCPGSAGKINMKFAEGVPICQTNMIFAVTPLVLTPFVPFRAPLAPETPASSRNLSSQTVSSRVPNPRTIAYAPFEMPFESLDLPGSGPIFPDSTCKNWPQTQRFVACGFFV